MLNKCDCTITQKCFGNPHDCTYKNYFTRFCEFVENPSVNLPDMATYLAIYM